MEDGTWDSDILRVIKPIQIPDRSRIPSQTYHQPTYIRPSNAPIYNIWQSVGRSCCKISRLLNHDADDSG